MVVFSSHRFAQVYSGFVYYLTLCLFAGFLQSCGANKTQRDGERTFLLSPETRDSESTSTGNLMATAIKEVNKVDLVLYPSAFLSDDSFGILSTDEIKNNIDRLLTIYPPEGVQDQFILGTMRGENIKKLVFARSQERYSTELQVAGIQYDINYVGGIPMVENISLDQDQPLEDGKNYRVAVSNYFYFSGATFPSYKYHDGLQSNLRQERDMVSARESLRSYLKDLRTLPNLSEIRARVSKHTKGKKEFVAIHDIQGEVHRSPYFGYEVTTRGIITAIAGREWYPGGTEIYLQSEKPDDNDLTSEALSVYLPEELVELKEGDVVEFTGVVYEELGPNGLGRTTLRDVTSYKKVDEGVALPDPILIGEGGRPIPDRVISSYRGNLNYKVKLNLDDGIDFWESLEGMLLTINNPRVVGFRGGKVDAESYKPKSYLNLYVVADGGEPSSQATIKGGLAVDPDKQDFNPEVIQLTTHTMAHGIAEDQVYKNGDILKGRLDGILGYEENIFGEGDYIFIIRKPYDTFSKRQDTQIPALDRRPQTRFVASSDTLRVATFNVENLGGNQVSRIQNVAKAVMTTLKCPDLVNFVEIQDRDGEEFGSNSKAATTLDRIISYIDQCPNVSYKALNIDPVNNGEGGQPGGNIRVAIIYDANKLDFTQRGIVTPLTETIIERDGSLSHNPGRVFPNDPVFNHTRKSIVAEFTYKGQKIFVIGNHFNSKLGDPSLWGANQPAILQSANRRAQLANRINEFVQMIEARNPGAKVIVLGDFNAYFFESPMKVLEGDTLTNLMSYGDLVPPNDRYSINYNGSSVPLDYIFVNKELLTSNPQLEVLHINSDMMGRISDHDPVIASFRF